MILKDTSVNSTPPASPLLYSFWSYGASSHLHHHLFSNSIHSTMNIVIEQSHIQYANKFGTNRFLCSGKRTESHGVHQNIVSKIENKNAVIALTAMSLRAFAISKFGDIANSCPFGLDCLARIQRKRAGKSDQNKNL